MKERKPNGYWTQDKVIQEINNIMQEHGFNRLPTQKELRRVNCAHIIKCITKHGGIRKFRQLLGQEQIRVEKHSWQSLDFTIQQAQQFLKEHPEFDQLPNANILCDLGWSSLNNAIKWYHGGFHKFRELLGEAPTREKHGSWQSLEFTIQQAQKIMIENGWVILPRINILQEEGYSSLSYAIIEYHGGFRKFRALLGQNQLEAEKGYWKDWENVKSELDEVILQLGHFPTSKELNKLRKSSLINGIQNFGGFNTVKSRMNFDNERKPMGYWQNYDNVRNEIQGIMEKYGFENVPDDTTLRDLGYSSLAYAIHKYHGGLNRIRIDFGEELNRAQRGQWQSLEFTIEQAKKAMKEHGWQILPTQKLLQQHRYSGLNSAIQKYHGGLEIFRETLRQHMTGKSSKQELEELLESYAGDDE